MHTQTHTHLRTHIYKQSWTHLHRENRTYTEHAYTYFASRDIIMGKNAVSHTQIYT